MFFLEIYSNFCDTLGSNFVEFGGDFVQCCDATNWGGYGS